MGYPQRTAESSVQVRQKNSYKVITDPLSCTEYSYKGFCRGRGLFYGAGPQLPLGGGLCLCLLRWFDDRFRWPLPAAALLAAAAVSGVELVFGVFCTRLLGLHVWDYSTEWGNIAGLICPKYCLLWFLLCFWLLGGLRALRRLLHKQTVL